MYGRSLNRNILKIGGLALGIFLASYSFGQTVKDSTRTKDEADDAFIWRPTIGLGVGSFTFIGDVGNNNKGFHPTVARLGYELRVSNPLTDYFDLTFYTIFGTVSSSERTPTRNLNFQSQIRTGGIVLNYNFLPLISDKRQWEPYIFTGIESFEFLSKTDLYDKYGNKYYYWNDGSIRNMAQNDPNAANSILLHRDYKYETDIRESNLDGFGKYPERSWAIPVGIGFQAILNQHWKFRFGTSMHFTFTDYIDGVSDKSVGTRQGNKANDKFLFTSFTLNYDIQRMGEKKKPPVEFEDNSDMMDILARDTVDSDGDRVVDFLDDCAFTPPGIPVDEKGCPFDKDHDLVQDFKDDEKATPQGNLVNQKGVTVTDEDIYQAFLRYSDSTGQFVEYNTIYEEMETFYSTGKKTNKSTFSYVVVVGTERKNVEPAELKKYLSTNDFKTVTSGDTVYYMVGNYKTVDEAIARKNELEKEGWKVDGIAVNEKNPDKNIDKVNIIPNDKLPDNTTAVNTAGNNNKDVLFRVQIGAFSHDVSPDVFRDAPDVVYVKGKDGITRYYSGAFKTIDEAAEHKTALVMKGYSGAFIVAYKENDRVPIEKVGATPVENVTTQELNPDEKTDVNIPVVNPNLIKYRVQIGAFKADVPIEMLDLFLQLENVKPVRTSGTVLYLAGEYNTIEEAEKALIDVKIVGLKDAFVVGDFNGKIITAEEAKSLLKK